MTLLDAYALVALLAEEPAADPVARILGSGTARVVVANLAEAVDVTQRIHGLTAQEVRSAIGPLVLSEVLEPVSSELAVAWSAGDLRAEHYDRRGNALSLADCLLLAQAVEDGDVVATADPRVAALARSLRVAVLPLADSTGRTP